MADLGGGNIGPPRAPGLLSRAVGVAGAALNVAGTMAFGISLLGTVAGYFSRHKKRSISYKTTEEQEKLGQEFALPVVYGQNKVRGHIIYREDSASTADEIETQFDMAVGFCEGEISRLKDVKLEGRNVEEFGSSDHSVYLGTANQVADSRFAAGVFCAPCVADAFVSQEHPSLNSDSGDSQRFLFVSNVAANSTFPDLPNDKRMDSLLRFDISDLPASLTIVSAEIRLHQDVVTAKHSIQAYATSGASAESWDETTVTFATAPGTGSALSGACEIKPNHTFGFIFLNSTGLAALKTAYAAGTTISFWIKPASGESLRYAFDSKEGVRTPPTLIIHYTGATPCAFRNAAYVAMTVDNRAGLLASKFPEITALVDGRLIYNWNATTSAYQTTYSNNPAWVLYDLLTNSRYGLGLDSSLIDMDSFKTVAAYCDASVTLPSGLTEKRYTCDLILDEQADGGGALTAILSSFLGYVSLVNGKFYLGCEKSETPGATLTTAHFIEGSFSYGKVDITEVPNIIRALYIDPANDFKKAYVQVESEIDRADRDDRILELPLYGVHRRSQAERIARLMLWRGLQQQYTCSFRLGIQDSDISVGDVRPITHAVPGWTAKSFRIVSVEETEDDELEIQAVEYVDIIATAETATPTTPIYDRVGGEGTVIERPAPSAPTWTVEGIKGGWRFKVTSQSVGAILHEIYMYYEGKEDWDYFNSIKETRGGQGTGQSQLTADFNPPDLSVRTYGRFKIRTVGANANSAFSAEQADWTISTQKTKAAPSAPTLAGSPTLTVKAIENGNAFLVDVVITAPSGEEDLISAYEIARANDGGTGTWTVYSPITIHALDPLIPGPSTITFHNTDRYLKPGWSYRYKVRAIGRNDVVSAWSSAAEITLAGDTTPPAQPTVAVQAKIHAIELTIAGGTESDFNYFKVEVNIAAGGWAAWKAQSKDTVHSYEPTSAQIAAGTTFEFRVTAYDVQGNASTVSATSTATAALKAGTEVFADLGVQDWHFDGAFSPTDYRVVAWASGTLRFGVGTTYSINAGNTGNMAARTYIYFDPAVSTTVLQVTTTAATSVGVNKKLIAVAQNVADTTKDAEYQVFGGIGGQSKLIGLDTLAVSELTADAATMNSLVAGMVAADVFIGSDFYASANIQIGSSNDVIRMSAVDSTYRLWIGHATAASAPFRVTKAGVVTATNFTMQTSGGDERVAIGEAGNLGYIYLYGAGTAYGKLAIIDWGSGDYLPYLYLESTDVPGLGGTYKATLAGHGLDMSANAFVSLPTGAFSTMWTPTLQATAARLRFNTSTQKLEVNYNSTTYTFAHE